MTNFKELTRFDDVKLSVNFQLVTRYNWVDDASGRGTVIAFDKDNSVKVKETPAEIKTR